MFPWESLHHGEIGMVRTARDGRVFLQRAMRLSFAWSWLIVTAGGGCQPDLPQMESRPVVPVDGRILVDGKTHKGIVVTLFSEDPTQEGKPQGITDADGKFRLETYRADGAPPGTYTVSVAWPGTPRKGEDAAAPQDRLGRRYVDPKASGLRAVVKGPSTTLPPFELK